MPGGARAAFGFVRWRSTAISVSASAAANLLEQPCSAS